MADGEMVVEFRWLGFHRFLPDRLANADVCKVGDTSCVTNNETIGRGAAADDEKEDAHTRWEEVSEEVETAGQADAS